MRRCPRLTQTPLLAFKELAEAVKAAPVTQVAPVAAPFMDGPIGMAAKMLRCQLPDDSDDHKLGLGEQLRVGQVRAQDSNLLTS